MVALTRGALGCRTHFIGAEAPSTVRFPSWVRSPLLLSSPFHPGSFPRLCYRPSPRCFCALNSPPSSRYSSSESAAVALPLPPPPSNVSLSSVLPYLWNLASGDATLGWRLFVALFLLIGGKTAGIVGPVFLKFAMDRLQAAPGHLQKQSTNLILGALIFSALSKAISAGMNEMRYVIFAPLGHATGRRVAVHLLDHILGMDLTFHLEKSTGVLARVIDRAQRAVVHIFRAVVFTFIPTAIELGLVCVLLARQVSTTVAGIVLVTFIAYVWWTIDITRAAASSRKEANKIEELVTGKVVDALLNFEMVAQSNNRKLEVRQYNNLLRRHQTAMVDAERLSAALNAGQAFILAIGVAVVMALAGLSVIQGSMTIGDLVLANGLILQLSGPLQFLGFLYRDLRQSLVDLDSLFKILTTRPSLKDGDVELPKSGPGVKLRVHDLHFSYKTSRKVLNGTSFFAEPGESVAIVGSSGSGKSTIVKLLLRLYDPDSGALFMDNLDLRTLTQASLRRAVAVVPQDTVLFNDTIFHNIAYSQPTASEAEVVVAAKQAQLHDAVMRMPGGYGTIVGERGLKLSGGEKQRVAIARAFLKAPRLLVCDEATSALDSKTEAGILRTLKELSSGVRKCSKTERCLLEKMVQQRIELLCGRRILEHSKGLQWLVGSRFLPYTIISVLQCLHFKEEKAGHPDLSAESVDIRIILPKGLEIIGAVLNEVGSLELAKRAGNIALQLATLVNSDKSSKPSNLIAACLEHSDSGLRFYNYDSDSGGIESFEDVVYHENPSAHLWSSSCLLYSELHLKLPVYAKSFANPSDYKAPLLRAIETNVESLHSDRLFYIVEGSMGTKRTILQTASKHGDNISTQDDVKLGDEDLKLRCSDVCSSNTFTTAHGLQMPMPLTLTLVLHQSKKSENNAAPCAEYLPVFEGAVLRVLNLKLAAICLAHQQLSLHEAVTSLVLPALTDQLLVMRDRVLQEFVDHTKLCAFLFCPPGFIHPISCIYDVSYGESELSTVHHRSMLHRRLDLPMDRPLLRIANSLSFPAVVDATDVKKQGRSRLSNVHINMPTSSEVTGGQCSIVQGSYEYYHYLQDNINDSGWGCAYRSLQTIISWFRLQHYTTLDVPTHEKIQEALVDIGDKEPSFKGSQNWIGAIELSFVLDKLLGVSSKILNVRSGAELPEKCRELALHFETQGTPIMIGGGVLAYTLLGVDHNDMTGDCAFLILDPHYTGGEDLKNIWAGGWCAWKKPISAKGEEFFLRNKFYNLLLPQRPNAI